MLGLAELGGRAVDLRARVDQLGRVELVAAVVALVAARLRVAADRARPLDVAVGQRVPGRRRERDEHLALDDRSVLVERLEDVLRDRGVVARRRAREAVVREAEPAEVLAERRVVVVGDLSVGLPLSIGGDHHRRAVLVRPADHENVVALEPVIARECVRRDAEARHMPQVAMARRIRPGGRYQDLPRCCHCDQSYEPPRAPPGTG